MIVVIGGIKGGSGKTTIAINLAVIQAQEGKKLILIDADDQKSSSDWVEHRENREIPTPWTTVQLTGPSLRKQVIKLKDSYEEIIIDTGGRDTASQRSALLIADIFLTPFQPKSLDIWTGRSLSNLIEEVLTLNPELKAFAFINRGDPTGSDNEKALQIIKEFNNFSCLPFTIAQRKAFSNATAEGLSVIEMKKKDKKAIKEIKEISKYIYCDIKKKLK